MGWWLFTAFSCSVIIVVIFRYLEKRSFVKGRITSSLEDIYANINTPVSFETFKNVWIKLGKSYGIDPGLIRPTDTFGELSKVDSWVLGKGEDEVTEWIDNFGAGRPQELATVMDLAN